MMGLLRSFCASMHLVIVWLWKCWAANDKIDVSSSSEYNIILAFRTLSPFNLFIELSYALGCLRNHQKTVLLSDKYMSFYSHEFLMSDHSRLFRYSYVGFNFLIWSMIKYGLLLVRCRTIQVIDISIFIHLGNGAPKMGIHSHLSLSDGHAISSLGRYYRSADNINVLQYKNDYCSISSKFLRNQHISRLIFDLSNNSIAAQRDDEGRFDLFLADIDEQEFVGLSDKVISMNNQRISRIGKDFWWSSGRDQSNVPEYVEEWVEAQKERGQIVIGLFPNLVWDNAAAFKSSNTIYHTLYDWLNDTVAILNENPGISLIVRGHPVELTQHASIDSAVMLIKDMVKNVNVDLFSRILFIEDSSVNSAFLAEIIDAVYLFNGTFGLEMMMKRINVIFASDAIMAQRTGYEVARSRGEIVSLLLNARDKNLYVSDDSYRRRLVCYYHYYFNLHSTPVFGVNYALNYKGRVHIDEGSIFSLIKL
jgi:hypothetical protein